MLKSRAWHREPYFVACIIAPMLGIAVIGADQWATSSKRQILSIKADGDLRYSHKEWASAITAYDDATARARGSRDLEVMRAIADASLRRETAAQALAKEKSDKATLLARSSPLPRPLTATSPATNEIAQGSPPSSESPGSYRGSSWRAPNLTPRRSSRGTARTSPPPASYLGIESPGTTATGIPLHVGPRGGVYHYSSSGRKVYERRKK